MGGQDSEHFFLFKSYCCTAFNILRKSSNLVLNLVSLMIDAELPHINQGEQSIFKVGLSTLTILLKSALREAHSTHVIHRSNSVLVRLELVTPWLFPPLLQVQEKFKLDLTDDQANQVMQQLIMDSARAFGPQFNEALHRLAQAMKS